MKNPKIIIIQNAELHLVIIVILLKNYNHYFAQHLNNQNNLILMKIN